MPSQTIPKKTLLFVFAVSFVAQWLYLAEGVKDPSFSWPVIDELEYHETARNIARGEFDSSDPFFQPPLFPYVLAGLYDAFGHSVRVAKFILAFCGPLTCLLTFLIAHRLFGPRVALLAGLLVALNGPLVFFHSRLMPTGSGIVLILLTLWAILWALESQSRVRWWVAGLCGGLAAITIANALLISLVVFLLAGVVFLRRIESIIDSKSWLLFIAGMVMAIAPVTLANFKASSDFVLISTNGGINLYLGNNLDRIRTLNIRPGPDWDYIEREPIREGARSAPDANAYFVSKTLNYILEHPADFARGILHKARMLVNGREWPRTFDIYTFRDFSHGLGALVWRAGPFAFPFGLLLPLALAGIVLAPRRDVRVYLLELFLLIYGLSVVLFFVSSRHRAVLIPCLAIFAAYALVTWFERRVSGRQLVLSVAVALAAGAVAAMPVRAPLDDLDAKAELYMLVGLQMMHAGELERAQASLETSATTDPEYAQAYNAMAELARVCNDVANVAAYCEQAIALDPDFAEAHHNLGWAYEKLGRMDEAEQAYRKAVALRSHLVLTWNNLGHLLLKKGDTGGSLAALREALRRNPYEPEALNTLTWVLSTHPDARWRDGEEAMRRVEILAQLEAGRHPNALDTMAAAYAEYGQYETASQIASDALRLGAAAGGPRWAADIKRRLNLYKAGKPYRDQSLAKDSDQE